MNKSAVIAISVCVLGGFSSQTAFPQAAPPPVSKVVRAKIRQPKKDMMLVEIVGRTADGISYRDPGSPGNVTISIARNTLEETEFELNFNEDVLNEALLQRNWNGVCDILKPVIVPVVPYLDLKDNNAIDRAVDLGTALMKSAAAMARLKDPDQEKVKSRYKDAYNVLRGVGAAAWFPGAEYSRVRAVLCLIHCEDYKRAAKELDEARVPEVGDGTFGIYWLAQALMEFSTKKYRTAIQNVVKSLVFETKDLESFPDALLLSGRCYEELLEPYRARDVYYEVAKLFPGTEWEGIGRERLQFIMDKGLTKTKEKADIAEVFFATTDDVNKLATDLLKQTNVVAVESSSISDDEDAMVEPEKKKDLGAMSLEPPDMTPEDEKPKAVKTPAIIQKKGTQ